MRSVVLAHEVDWAGWRNAARGLALAQVHPQDVVWSVGTQDDLFARQADALPSAEGAMTVPRALLDVSRTVIRARDASRFSLLYHLVWRAHRGERHVMDQASDPQVLRTHRLAHAVRRDMHKMRAFVRFRAVEDADGTRHVAWFEPDHFIVEANADFFIRRFATMLWSILTPDGCAHWNGTEVVFTPGARREDIPDDDAWGAYWRAYFSAIFNPGRLKVGAMMSEMPRKYWRNLPETAAIPELIRAASGRVATMVDRPVFSPPRPGGRARR